MKDKGHKKKKATIFQMFLIPLIVIMLVQSVITIGTLVIRRTTGMLEEYSGSMMNRLVENRKVILQNDMNQRWAAVHEQETYLDEILESRLKDGMELNELLASDELKSSLLEMFFPECLDMLQSSSVTGVFVILAGNDMHKAGEFDGFFIRDSDPDTNPANYTDLLLERGSKHLSREWNIPLDTSWTTRFHMAGLGQNQAEKYFYEPWRVGEEYGDADTEDLGYWALPFYLEKDKVDSYEMITYSLPLRHQGCVYGVLGVEISTRKLYDYFPISELNDSQQSGYMLAMMQEDGGYRPLAGKGILYNLVCSMKGAFSLEETDYENLWLVQDVRLDNQGVYAVACPLKLYSNNVPYEDTEWVLLGLNTEQELFGVSRQLYIWMMAAIFLGLAFGVVGIYILVKHLTKPVQHLMQCISGGNAGLQGFKPSNILEIDALYGVVNDLTMKQKEVENILLEEKERYRVALESSKDIFFSYDLDKHILDIVNHATMSGQWDCEEHEGGFINPSHIHDMDRSRAIEELQGRKDTLYVEFRLKWPEDSEYKWVALSGKAVYDTDGRRRKLMGSIRDIQEQKEKEEAQLRKNRMDGVTGLYAFSAGMESLKECRRLAQEAECQKTDISMEGRAEDRGDSGSGDGVMIDLVLGGLNAASEKNGIVFADMILEEIGKLIRGGCEDFLGRTGRRSVALRFDRDEFVLWMEGMCRKEAEEFIRELLGRVAGAFEAERFNVRLQAGLVCGERDQTAEKLISMAKLACRQVSSGGDQYQFYEDVPEESRRFLPALQGKEISGLEYDENVSLVSVALNLFGKGADFPAQMMLMIRKIGRFYEAGHVLVSVLRDDFNSNYLNYQWHRNGEHVSENVRKYKEEEKEAFCSWLGQGEVRYFSEEDSRRPELQCFLSVKEGQQGFVLPMYDNGNYMGNICILGISRQLVEDAEEYQNLAELGRVIQSQLNQQQYDIASKAKSEFLSRMSHEIRTPMNGIIGMTAIALQQDQSQERIMDCLQKIQSSSDYLLGLINDILDMSKIESGKMKLEPVNFNMREMLDTIGELIAPQAAAKRIEFVQDVRLAHDWFRADRMRISQVLINLLGNAAKFTPAEGRITLRVQETEQAKGESKLYFAVSDTGVGIAKEDQDRVFRSFEQAGGANPAKQQGTGLGLSISSRLVQMMGSSIQLDSTLGVGSTFSFSILLGLGENVESAAQEEEISFDGYHILVVEDNELNAEIARCLLEDKNFQVDCVYDGAQAVERIENTAPGTYDVILMDICMPVMDGLDATRAIRSMEREDCHTVPIVAMSANAFDDDLKKSVECGMNGHLSKPVEVDKLYQTLREVIKGQS